MEQAWKDRSTAFGGDGEYKWASCPRARNWRGSDHGVIMVAIQLVHRLGRKIGSVSLAEGL